MVPAPMLLPSVEKTVKMGTNVEASKLLAFLGEYRVLECSCCSKVFGFQHKITGALFCVGGCHEHGAGAGVSTMSMPSAVLNQVDASQVETSVSNQLAQLELSANNEGKEKPKPTPLMDVRLMNGVGMDRVDSGGAKPQPVAAAPKPLEPLKPAALKPVELPKPAAPKPVEARKPVAPAPKRHLWSDMKYSEKLLSPNATVRVQYAWTCAMFTVSTEAEEDIMAGLTEQLKKYAASAKPLTQPPVENEIVVAEYDGEFYRARVKKVEAGNCVLVFIDYGDKKTCQFSEVFPVDDALMKHPVYGLIVQLKLPVPTDGYVLAGAMEDSVFADSYILDMNKKGPAPVPGKEEYYEARMWDTEKENTLNEKITGAISASRK